MDSSRNKHKRKNNDESRNDNKRQKPSPSLPEKIITSAEKTNTTAQSRIARIRAQQAAERSNASPPVNTSSIDPTIKLQKNVVKFPINDSKNKSFEFGKKTSPGRNNAHSVTLSCVAELKSVDNKTQKFRDSQMKQIVVGLSPSERLKMHKMEALKCKVGDANTSNERKGEQLIKQNVSHDKLNPSYGSERSLNSVRDKSSVNSFKDRSSFHSFNEKSSLDNSNNKSSFYSFKDKSPLKAVSKQSVKPYELPSHSKDRRLTLSADKNVSIDLKQSKAQSTPLSTKSVCDRLKVSRSIKDVLTKTSNHSTPSSSKDDSSGFFTPSSSLISLEKDKSTCSKKSNNSQVEDSLIKKPKSANDRLKVAKNVDDKNSQNVKFLVDNEPDYQSPLRKFNAHSTPIMEPSGSVFNKRDDSKLTFSNMNSTKSPFAMVNTEEQKSPFEKRDSSHSQKEIFSFSVSGAEPEKPSSFPKLDSSKQEPSSISSPFGNRSVFSASQSQQEHSRGSSVINSEASSSFKEKNLDPPNESNKKSSLLSFEFVSDKLKSLSSKFFQGGTMKRTPRFTPYEDNKKTECSSRDRYVFSGGLDENKRTNFENKSVFSGSTNFDNKIVFQESLHNRVLQTSNEQNFANRNICNTLGSFNTSENNAFSGNFDNSNRSFNSFNNNAISGSYDTSNNNAFSGTFNISNNNATSPSSNNIFERNSNISGPSHGSMHNVFQNGVIVDPSSRNFGNVSVFSRTSEENVFSSKNTPTSKLNEIEDEDNDMDWSPEIEEQDEQNLIQMKNMISQQTSYHESEAGKTVDEACGWEEVIFVVVDTNVFLHKLEVLANILKIKYEDGTYPILYVPWMVIQELDYFKDGYSSNKKYLKSEQVLNKSRKAISFINQALVAKKPNFKCEPAKAATVNSINISSPDDSILSSCLNLRKNKNQVMLLSGDVNLRNKALINDLESLTPERAVGTLSKLKKLKRDEDDLIDKASQRMSWLCSYVIYTEWKETGDKSEASRFEKMPWSFPECIRYMKENYDRVFKPFLQKQCQKIIDDIYNSLILNEDLMEETKFVELVLSLLIYMKTGMRKYEKNITLVMDDIKKLNP